MKDACNSAIQSKKIELENLKKSYESFNEAKKNYCKSFYNHVLSNKEYTLGQWESEYKSLLKAEKENGVTKYQTNTNRKHIMNMCVFCFIKSPEFGDDKWHLHPAAPGYSDSYSFVNSDMYEYNEYVSYLNWNKDGKRKLHRTSEMILLVNNQNLCNLDKTISSEEQIKMLRDTGFKEFLVLISLLP